MPWLLTTRLIILALNMMYYPLNTLQSGNPVSETLENLVQLRRSLLELFIKSKEVESCQPLHSLFSSKRVYRSDELYAGLTPNLSAFGFSKN